VSDASLSPVSIKVAPPMFGYRNAFKVGNVVIQRVPVDVMNLMTVRNLAVNRPPYLTMKIERGAFPSGVQLEVNPVIPSFRVGISTPRSATPHDGFNVRHDVLGFRAINLQKL
jgi:hypothetical protein